MDGILATSLGITPGVDSFLLSADHLSATGPVALSSSEKNFDVPASTFVVLYANTITTSNNSGELALYTLPILINNAAHEIALHNVSTGVHISAFKIVAAFSGNTISLKTTANSIYIDFVFCCFS